MMQIPLARPQFSDGAKDAVMRVLSSGWVLQGPEVAAFERELAGFLGSRACVAVSSGTAALHLSLVALGVGPGDDVIVPSHSFIATTNVVRLVGANPIFVDIDPETFCPSPDGVEAAITSRTRAVIAVHQMGMPADLPRLLEVAERAGVPLIEDAACALGSELLAAGQWQRIGRPHGRIACFSFHPRKVITSGEGGAVSTNDVVLAARILQLRQHGLADARGRCEEPGYNYRMTDIQAALLRAQLPDVPAIVERQRQTAALYAAAIAGTSLRAPTEPAFARSNFQSYCIRAPSAAVAERLRERLGRHGIESREGIANAHEQPAYFGTNARALIHSEAARRECVLIPCHSRLVDDERARIIAVLRGFVSSDS
jgi:dTDP-4-amino-4,6-dideoxygalactose transaminase